MDTERLDLRVADLDCESDAATIRRGLGHSPGVTDTIVSPTAAKTAISSDPAALSAVVIGILVVGALAGAFTLPVAVLGHEISEFTVVGTGLRMHRA